jgi:hypothetical protein
MTDLLAPILAVIPEAHRPTVVAIVSIVGVAQIIASQIIAQLPKSAVDHPRYGRIVRALHWFGHARFHDETGTTKLPGGTVLDDPRDAELARLRALVASSVPVEVVPAAEREENVAPAPSEAKSAAE